MIIKPNADELAKKCTNKYELVIIISKRARQIVSGDIPRIKTGETSEITISSLEYEQDKYSKEN